MASQRHTTRQSSTDKGRFCKAEVRLLSQMKAFLTSKARPNHLINLNHCPTIKDGSESLAKLDSVAEIK